MHIPMAFANIALTLLRFASPVNIAAAGDFSETIDSGGVSRTYVLHVPAVTARPMPLVLVFHGGGGQGRTMERYTHLDELADRYGFIVAYPDGLRRQWNDGRLPHNNGAQDVAFVRALIDRIESEYPVDRKRVFAAGMSNGAMFSQRLGCELSDRIAAFAAVSGNLPEAIYPSCAPARAISVLQMSGTDDPLVPYNGGNVVSPRGGGVLSVDQTVKFWAKSDGCNAGVSVVHLTPVAPPDGTDVVRKTYRGCRNGSAVVLYTIDGGGHAWPGKVQYLPAFIVGKASDQIDGNATIIDFFMSHPMR